MNVLIIYDSVFGHTEQIALAMGKAFDEYNNVRIVKATEMKEGILSELDLLIIGSPTHGGRYTEAVQDFLKKISKLSTSSVRVAAFDTRTSSTGFLAKIEQFFGHAAVRIANNLKKQDKVLITEPEGFIVNGRKGPLREGELDRAESWAKEIADKIKAMSN